MDPSKSATARPAASSIRAASLARPTQHLRALKQMDPNKNAKALAKERKKALTKRLGRPVHLDGAYEDVSRLGCCAGPRALLQQCVVGGAGVASCCLCSGVRLGCCCAAWCWPACWSACC